MTWFVIEPPATGPVTLNDALGQIRVDFENLVDAPRTVEMFISAIREVAMDRLNRALITQKMTLRLDGFPRGRVPVELPLPPLQSVEEIRYTATDGASATLDVSAVTVDTASEPGRIMPVYGTTWPAALADYGSVEIDFTAGYGDSPADIPASVRQWMLINIANLYENRESIITTNGKWVQSVDITSTLADGLINSLRIRKL